ncbi:MAG: DNA polymerase III subunit beta [Gammaproteobacteria bacterium AqS3]|nr:DNA polymerase III subunit beta [Gammaproteobacteria bacterium AqS3]
MKIDFTKEALMPFLGHNNEVSSTHQNFTKQIHLQASGSELVMTTTDGTMWLRSCVDGITVQEQGSVSLVVQDLFKIVRGLPSEKVVSLGQIPTEGEAGGLTMRIQYDSVEYDLNGDTGETFPGAKELKVPVCSVNVGELRTLLKHTYYAMAQKDVRHYLNGMKLEIAKDGDGIVAVAMDGHRMAFAEIAREGEDDDSDQQDLHWHFLLPSKSIQTLMNLLEGEDDEAVLEIFREDENVKDISGGDQISMKIGKTVLVTRLIDADFPEFRHIIPKQDPEHSFDVDNKMLLENIQRVALLSNTSPDNPTSVHFMSSSSDRLRMICNRDNTKEGAKTELDITWTSGPGELRIRYNIQYIKDALSAIPEAQDVLVRFSVFGNDLASRLEQVAPDPSPASLRAFCLVMPLRN